MNKWKQNAGLQVFLVIAIVFLELLTAKLAWAKTNPKVEFILDVSGSMNDRVDGRTKIAVAKEVFTNQINQLPDDIDVGLMVFGHRWKRNCEDIEQIVPVGPVNKRRLIAAIKGLSPKGKTPIALAIRKAFEVLKPMEEKATIVLISDGKETCKGNPFELVNHEKASGSNFVIHVIGLGGTGEERAQLEHIADAAGGKYYAANDAGEFKLVKEVLPDNFEVVVRNVHGNDPGNWSGKISGPEEGEVTPRVRSKRLPAGDYSLKFQYKNRLTELTEEKPFSILKARKTTLTFKVGLGILDLAVKDAKGQKAAGWTAVVLPEGKDVAAAELNSGMAWTPLVPGNYLVRLRREFQGRTIQAEQAVTVKVGERTEVPFGDGLPAVTELPPTNGGWFMFIFRYLFPMLGWFAFLVVAVLALVMYFGNKLTERWLTKDVESYKKELSKDLETHKKDLGKDLETHKIALQYEVEKDLILRRGEVDIFRDQLRNWNETEGQRQARVRAQILRWANPIFGAISDLSQRLTHIIDENGYEALSSKNKDEKPPKQGFMNYKYYMASTLYYFAQYFCWTRMLQLQMSFELFDKGGEMKEFQKNIEGVSSELFRFPYKDKDAERKEQKEPNKLQESNTSTKKDKDAEPNEQKEPTDKQLFHLQQRAIGEIILIRADSGEHLLSYSDFFDKWSGSDFPKFWGHLKPLEDFLIDVNKSSLVWKRLEGMRDQLKQFETLCESKLRHSNKHGEAQ